jgi:hypothetical protein
VVDDDRPQPADMFDWVRVIDGIKFGASVKGVAAKTIKLIAYRLAMFGDPDGSNVRPGPARIAAVCEVDYTTAKKVYGLLRDWGLITKVRGSRGPAGGREFVGDEYQLTVPLDLLERFHHRDPTELRREAEEIQSKHRRGAPRKVSDSEGELVDNPELRGSRTPATSDAVGRVAGESSGPNSELRVNPDASWGGIEPAIPTSDLPPTSTNHDHSWERNPLPSTADAVEDPDFDEVTRVGDLFGAGLPLRQTVCGNPLCHGGVLKIGINRRPCPTCNTVRRSGEVTP